MSPFFCDQAYMQASQPVSKLKQSSAYLTHVHQLRVQQILLLWRDRPRRLLAACTGTSRRRRRSGRRRPLEGRRDGRRLPRPRCGTFSPRLVFRSTSSRPSATRAAAAGARPPGRIVVVGGRRCPPTRRGRCGSGSLLVARSGGGSGKVERRLG